MQYILYYYNAKKQKNDYIYNNLIGLSYLFKIDLLSAISKNIKKEI